MKVSRICNYLWTLAVLHDLSIGVFTSKVSGATSIQVLQRKTIS